MVDIPGNNLTGATVTVGSTTAGTLETLGDHDWYRIQLTAGQSISVALNGVTLEDPYLRVRDAGGNIVYEHDDITAGVNRDSLLGFTATSTGTYYIDVGAFDDGYAGTFNLVVSSYSPPPVGTADQFATQLVSGYWDGDSHRFNAAPGGNISVNLTGLTPSGRTLAREALNLWTDVIGVTFREVTTSAQITFDDEEEGAHASAIWSNGITSSANVNVSTQWLIDYGSGLNGYAFQAYVHEIGHALGLGHAGNYNDTARYPFEALYANDGWPMSIMSYFDQTENTHFADQGYTRAFTLTPMVADIVAASQLYGLSTTTRTGDTVYGVNSTAGRAIYDANAYSDIAFTIFDSGGVDTLNYSAGQFRQSISLLPEMTSFVGDRITFSIARGVVIENAVGNDGDDVITGNHVGNVLTGNGGADAINGLGGDDTLVGGSGIDRLTGGDGADTFKGTLAGMNGDAIVDLTRGDRIHFTDANLATFSFRVEGSIVSYNGGTLNLTAPPARALVASAAADGGVQLTLGAGAALRAPGRTGDFNGDGRDDIMWRNDSGAFSQWLGLANGGFAGNDRAAGSVATSWNLAAIGDFNGDQRDDLMWRHESGAYSQWLGQANGGFVGNDAIAGGTAATSWKIVGTGDFNGDGRDDLIWRHDSGAFSEWLGQANGGFVGNDAIAGRSVATSWHVVGTGDFNGDGRDDIIWRNDSGAFSEWLGQANGGFAGNAAANFAVDRSWHVAGTGDFNGDGRDDVLWRNDSGAFTEWLGQANGGFVGNDANAGRTVANSWKVAATGDFNGDNRDDILWRNDNGAVSEWLGQANGGFVGNPNVSNQVDTSWHVQPDYLLI